MQTGETINLTDFIVFTLGACLFFYFLQTCGNDLDIGTVLYTFYCQFIDGQSFRITLHTLLKASQVSLSFLDFVRMKGHGTVNLSQLARCGITLTEEVLGSVWIAKW